MLPQDILREIISHTSGLITFRMKMCNTFCSTIGLDKTHTLSAIKSWCDIYIEYCVKLVPKIRYNGGVYVSPYEYFLAQTSHMSTYTFRIDHLIILVMYFDFNDLTVSINVCKIRRINNYSGIIQIIGDKLVYNKSLA